MSRAQLGSFAIGIALLVVATAAPAQMQEMVLVPEGVFTMGLAYDPVLTPYPSEMPQHTVYLNNFWIDKTEVTVDAYGACVTAGVCGTPGVSTGCNWGLEGRGDHPINCITWYWAEDYCEWVGKRLPTEAEWEKAARGVDARYYPWGGTSLLDQQANCDYAVTAMVCTPAEACSCPLDGCGLNRTWPVGSKPPDTSPYGALDMAGNVKESVQDWFGETYYTECDPQPCLNPTGPASGAFKSARGGAWTDCGYWHQCGARNSTTPDGGRKDWGFRCAADAPKVVYGDGFVSGDTSRWSATIP